MDTTPIITTSATTTPSRSPVARVRRGAILAVGAAAAFAAFAAKAKRRHIVRRFEGKTPSEARAAIVEYATKRTGDAERAAHIADRVVDRLQQRGVLAPETDEPAA